MYMRRKFLFLFLITVAGLLHCGAQTLNTNRPSDPSLIRGKGSLSFKLNGKIYHANPSEIKCWTTAKVPVAILWAKGDDLNISLQIQHMKGTGIYRIDKDSSGKTNFTVGGKVYWIKRTDGSNYLNVVITGIKDLYSVKLLSGSFEGILEDGDGHRVNITAGLFTTEGI